MILAFSGIDCSGKSTQIRLIKRFLEGRGERVTVIWYRPGYSNGLDWMRKLVRRVRPGALPSGENTRERQRVFRNPWIRWCWILMAVLDTIFVYGLKARMLSLLGHIVICDRYVEDAVIDLRLRFSELVRCRPQANTLLKMFCPVAHHRFLLMLPKGVLVARALKKQEPFPDSPEIRDRRFYEYEKLGCMRGLLVIDATKPIEAVQEEIQSALHSHYGNIAG